MLEVDDRKGLLLLCNAKMQVGARVAVRSRSLTQRDYALISFEMFQVTRTGGCASSSAYSESLELRANSAKVDNEDSDTPCCNPISWDVVETSTRRHSLQKCRANLGEQPFISSDLQ